MEVATGNPRIHITEQLRTVETLPRRCDVIMIHSRGTSPWCAQAIASVHESDYPNMGLVVVDNNDHALSIGAAWNMGVKASRADDVLFLGDDDYIGFDLVSSLMSFKQRLRKQPNGGFFVSVSSPCTAIDQHGKVMLTIPKAHTGLYDREWLVRNPFNEALEKFVDSEMTSRLMKLNEQRPHYTCLQHQGGYYYRQHIGNVSGSKVQYAPRKA